MSSDLAARRFGTVAQCFFYASLGNEGHERLYARLAVEEGQFAHVKLLDDFHRALGISCNFFESVAI